jgi:predicted phage terminase large subunit-like protein
MRKPLTAEERELWRYLERMDGVQSLIDFVPLVTPRYHAPNHLRPLAEAFYRADQGQAVFLCSSTPPRHAKTESILHWCARYLLHHPEQTIAYATYEAHLAQDKSRVCRDIALRAGVQLKHYGSARYWTTKQGGGFRATSVDGPITGMGIHMLIVDDPFKNRKEAESQLVRDNVHQWFTSTAGTRFEPGHSPKIIVNMARWHDDDLVGRLTQSKDVIYEYMNLPAIADDGSRLWPSAYTVEAYDLLRRMAGEYDWASLYQGMPMPRSGYMFREPTRYTFPDIGGIRIAIGCDPAATAKTSSDYSVIIVVGAKGSGPTQTVDVLDLWRGQVEIPALVKRLHDMQVTWGAPVFVEAVGGFKAVPQTLRQIDPKLRVVDINPTTDKFTRALPAKAAWNDGRLRVPRPGATPWVDDFVREVCKFTGKNDAKDDQVDALAHAFNAVDMRMPTGLRGVVQLPVGSGLV